MRKNIFAILALAAGYTLCGMPGEALADAESQENGTKAFEDICAGNMPDVDKIVAFARGKWHEPQRRKDLSYWSAGVPGRWKMVLSAGHDDGMRACNVFFAGEAPKAQARIEKFFKVKEHQDRGGVRLWMINWHGKDGMVFLKDSPQSPNNINLGLYLEE
jgi:hypothetical protein